MTYGKLGAARVGAPALPASAVVAEHLPSTRATTTDRRPQVCGVGVFSREAGPKYVPTIVPLHGFPSSSRMVDAPISLLATRYHLMAPDSQGFGQSESPPTSVYTYFFDDLAQTMEHLLEAPHLDRYSLYTHDCGVTAQPLVAILGETTSVVAS